MRVIKVRLKIRFPKKNPQKSPEKNYVVGRVLQQWRRREKYKESVEPTTSGWDIMYDAQVRGRDWRKIKVLFDEFNYRIV